MVTVTRLETAVLKAMVNNEFFENGPESVLWIDCLWEAPTGLTFSGTVSSLVQKGLVVSGGETIQLTPAGWEIAKELVIKPL